MINKIKIKELLKWSLLSTVCGLFAGVFSSLFLYMLDWVTKYRDNHLFIIWALPLAGLLIGCTYHNYSKDTSNVNNLILDEIHDPKKIIPAKMVPLVLFGTLLTHLFGGSAGREGTAVQMGASLSDQLSRCFKIEKNERRILLVAGAGAGFGAAIGAPWAGVVFGMEIINIGKLKLFALFECLVASFVGYFTTLVLNAPHSHFPLMEVESFTLKNLFFISIAGIIFGLTAKVFSMTAHFIEKINNRFISIPPLRPFFGGLVLVSLYYFEGTYKYVGLGVSSIQQSLITPSHIFEPLLKIIFTSITIGSGFKGGEFIPLVFIGSTLGSFLSLILPVSFKLLAALGFAAVFAGASNAPIACSIMAMEIFGLQIGLYAFVACFMSYYFSGHHGVYRSQIVYFKKHQKIKLQLLWLGELPKRFLNGVKRG